MKQKIQNLIIKYLLRRYFRNFGLLDISEEQHIGGYADMDTDRIFNTLRQRFTNLLAEQVSAKKGSEDTNKGRILELLGLMFDIENAKENLVKLAEKKKQEEYRVKQPDIFQKIKNKLTGFRKATKRDSNL